LFAGIVSQLKAGGTTDLRLALALAHLAEVRTAEGRHAEAASLISQSTGILKSDPADEPALRSAVWHILGTSLYYQQRYSEAERAYRTALDLSDRTESRDAHTSLELLSNLGSIYEIERRYSEARQALERASALLDQMPNAPSYLRASVFSNIGVLHHTGGRHTEAVTAFRQALDIIDAAHTPDSLLTLQVLNNLAAEYVALKKFADAAPLFSRAVKALESGAALPRTDVLQIVKNYAACLQKVGDKDGALALRERSARILDAIPSQDAGGKVIDVGLLRSAR
jgi:tetratricopeptide (TPR) repeat protein